MVSEWLWRPLQGVVSQLGLRQPLLLLISAAGSCGTSSRSLQQRGAGHACRDHRRDSVLYRTRGPEAVSCEACLRSRFDWATLLRLARRDAGSVATTDLTTWLGSR